MDNKANVYIKFGENGKIPSYGSLNAAGCDLYATKYMEIKPGEIKINLYKERVFSMVSISNKSEEISKEDLKKLFDRFYRLDKSRTASTGGSGLGLAIAKSIVEMHKGSIWAEYQKGYITFYIKLIMVEDE